MYPTFSTRNEATSRLIIEPIMASGLLADDDEVRATYDIDAIAAAYIVWDDAYDVAGDVYRLGDQGFRVAPEFCDQDGLGDDDAFWMLVEGHERRPVSLTVVNANVETVTITGHPDVESAWVAAGVPDRTTPGHVRRGHMLYIVEEA